MTKCNRTSEDSNTPGLYYPCSHKAFATVSYLSVGGREIRESLCKMHFNSLVKQASRILKMSDYDMKLKTHTI